MKEYRYLRCIAAVCFTLLFATSVLAQTQIDRPTNGETVNGVVRVSATKADPRNGWISYKFTGPGQAGKFTVALMHPYRFDWDTNAINTDGERVYPDGEYTVTAVGYSPAGQKAGEDSVRVTVRNDLSAAESPGAVKLQTDYKRATELQATADGSCGAKLKEHNATHAEIIKTFNGMLEAAWRERAMSNSAGGTAIVRKYFDRGYTSFEGMKPTNLPLAGQMFTLLVRPNARIDLKHSDDDHFPLGELYIELPDRTLRKGSTWQSPMYVLPMLRAEKRSEITGHHRLDGFQWAQGFKCARIVSTFSENDVTLKLRMGEARGQERSMEMEGPGGGEPMDFPGEDLFMDGPAPAEEEMMMPEGEIGPGGRAGGQASAPPTAQVKTSYKGTRISYFAYEFGQVIRTDDQITHTLTIDSSQFGGGAGGGMMDEEGMMGPGMEPGMMEPDMMGPMGAEEFDMENMLAGDSEDRRWARERGMMPSRTREPAKKEFEAEAQVKLSVKKHR
ncbi:MAG: hypothetical protein ACLFWB_02500 [Armatimonadota bacterium]